MLIKEMIFTVATDVEFKKWQSLSPQINKICLANNSKVLSREFNKGERSVKVLVEFKDETSLHQAYEIVDRLLIKNEVHETNVSMKTILPKNISKKLEQFNEAVSDL
jgi:deoxyinosine 3'endonuclease (endonuclease V)